MLLSHLHEPVCSVRFDIAPIALNEASDNSKARVFISLHVYIWDARAFIAEQAQISKPSRNRVPVEAFPIHLRCDGVVVAVNICDIPGPRAVHLILSTVC